MAIRLGDEAPDFTAETTEGTVNFYDYLGDGWGILFSHPKDFTPVCTTELGAFSARRGDFDKRNTKLIAVSVDDVDSHQRWKSDISGAQRPDHWRRRPKGRGPLRHDSPERERHVDRAKRLHRGPQ
jgi:alkyl hydroperoxide reductase subunit AhpC